VAFCEKMRYHPAGLHNAGEINQSGVTPYEKDA